jgi:molybdopterin-guanine dinucleotide biosynthesis protein A
MRLAGVVLCGGRSSRMGRPKAWLPFQGEPVLVRVLKVLAQAVPTLVAVAAPGQDLPPLPAGVEVVRDPEEGHGPLEGIAAGLAVLVGRADAAYVSSCDVPFLDAAFVRRMFELLGDHEIAVPDVGGYRHPLAGVYRMSVLPAVRGLLAAKQMRLGLVFDRVSTRFVTEAELPGLAPLRNLNTPEEYEAALREAGA